MTDIAYNDIKYGLLREKRKNPAIPNIVIYVDKGTH